MGELDEELVGGVDWGTGWFAYERYAFRLMLLTLGISRFGRGSFSLGL